METIILIIFLIVIIMLYREWKDYKDSLIARQNFNNELVEEGKELRKKAEEKMAKEKCSKGGNCNFILNNTTKKHLYGWCDEITGHYCCTKCNKTRDVIIQNPN